MQWTKRLKLNIIIPVLLFAAFMTWLIFIVSASTPFASLEPESSSLSSGATIASDSSATGGSFIQFGTASTGGGGGSGNPWDGAGVKSFACSGVTINVGDNWQSKVDVNPSGTTFCIKAGVHRMQQVVPKANNTFIGEPGAIMNGSKVLTGWSQSGSDWVVGGQTQGPGELNGAPDTSCWGDSPRCNYPNELFLDGKRLRHVSSRAEMGPGKWYFDYDADKIYMRDNPSGHTVETSVTYRAFEGAGADYVTIKGLTIEKYATPVQKAVIEGFNSSHYWTVDHNEIRNSQGSTVKGGCNWKVTKNYLHHQGQIGITGACGGLVVEGNEIAFNNEAHANWYWEGGGTKFIWTTGLAIRGNYVHDNFGPGIWTDGHNTSTLYEDNLVEDNYSAGIFHEIGCDAIIRNNRIVGNGFGNNGWIDGGGIVVGDSPDVEIYGNDVINNNDGITAKQTNRTISNPQCETATKNLWVHDNYIEMQTGQTGIAGNPIYDSNKFDRNTYKLGSSSEGFYRWGSTITDKAGWQSFGQDLNGVWK